MKPPVKIPNIRRRPREYLTPLEIEKLINAIQKKGRYGHRNATMILMAYRHGLRVSELVALRWSQIDLQQGIIYVNRLKNGYSNTHPLFGSEIRSLRKIRRYFPEIQYVFVTERKSPMTDSMFRKIIAQAGIGPALENL